MYLVAKNGDENATDPLIQADHFVKTLEYTEMLEKSFPKQGVSQILAFRLDNKSMLESIGTRPGVEAVHGMEINLHLLDQLPSGIIHPIEQGVAKLSTYDLIIEGGYIEHNSDFFKSVHDLLNNNGTYINSMMIYQEPQLKKKLLNFLLKGYQIEIIGRRVGSTILPLITLKIQKKAEDATVIQEGSNTEEGSDPTANKINELTLNLPGETAKLTLMEAISKLRDFMLDNTHSFDEIVPGRRVTFECYVPETSKIRPKYIIHFYDSDDSSFNQSNTYSCFIVPEGREESFMFRTKRGNKQFSKMVKSSRLAIVILLPGSPSMTFDGIQKEVESIIVDRKPKYTVGKIPFMTDGDYQSSRKIVYSDESVIVEDYLGAGAGTYFRRLLFQSNYQRVQGEIELNLENATGDFSEEVYGVLPHLEGKKPVCKISTLDSSTQRVIFTAAKLFGAGIPNRRIGLLGMGTGHLGSYLEKYIPGSVITEVESSQKVVELAKKFFFSQRKETEIKTEDAFEYVRNAPPQSLDLIVVDLDSIDIPKEEKMLVPASKFRSAEFFDSVSKALSDGGFLIYTIIHKKGEDFSGFALALSKYFTSVVKAKAQNDDQTIYILSVTETSVEKIQNLAAEGFKTFSDDFTAEEIEENEFDDIKGLFEITYVKGFQGSTQKLFA